MNHKIVPGDKRILDPMQFGLLGQTLNIIADNSDGINKDPNVILVPRVSAIEAGSSFIQRNLSTSRKLNAENQYSPSIITLAIESTLTKRVATLSNTKSTNLQGVLKYGTGMANQGTQSSAPLSFAGIDLDPRIIFDLVQGTVLSFPASYFQLDLLYTATTTDDGGGTDTFIAGEPIGPNYQVIYSLGYEPQAHPNTVTMTQLAPATDLGAGDTTFFFRPKYSTGVYFVWQRWDTDGPVQIFFYNAEGLQVFDVNTYPSTTVSPPILPPPIIPWPADAVAVAVTNNSGDLLPFFKCVSILGF